jgi:hypothetical protein
VQARAPFPAVTSVVTRPAAHKPGGLGVITVTSPPIMRASLRVMARPKPVPPKRCAVVLSAWLNSWNSFAYCSGVMPMAVSATATSIHSRPLATRRARSLTSPSLVNLQALLRRLSRICRSRMGSTVMMLFRDAQFAPKNGQKPKPSGSQRTRLQLTGRGRNHPPRRGSFLYDDAQLPTVERGQAQSEVAICNALFRLPQS